MRILVLVIALQLTYLNLCSAQSEDSPDLPFQATIRNVYSSVVRFETWVQAHQPRTAALDRVAGVAAGNQRDMIVKHGIPFDELERMRKTLSSEEFAAFARMVQNDLQDSRSTMEKDLWGQLDKLLSKKDAAEVRRLYLATVLKEFGTRAFESELIAQLLGSELSAAQWTVKNQKLAGEIAPRLQQKIEAAQTELASITHDGLPLLDIAIQALDGR